MEATIPRKVPKNAPYLSPSINLIPEEGHKTKETELVEFQLKVKAGSGVNGSQYKKKVAKFHGGSVSEWIAVKESLAELWEQNSVTGAADRNASIKTVLRDDALTAYEASLQESKSGVEGNENLPMNNQMIEKALDAVSREVFPHRALEVQKLWMRRGIKKPKEMPYRKMAAAVAKINKALSHFPGATEDDQFKNDELLEILEWSLPPKWRAKFDLDGYVPSLHDRARLLAECEQLERAELTNLSSAKKPDSKVKDVPKKKVHKAKGKKPGKKFYCKHHGSNTNHTTEDCYTLKNRANKRTGNVESSVAKTSFSKNQFRKEVHSMSKGGNKMEVLDLYYSTVKKERKKEKARVAKSKAKTLPDSSSNSESESDHSVHVIDVVPPVQKLVNTNAALKSSFKEAMQKHKAKMVQESEPMVVEQSAVQMEIEAEEKAFQKRLLTLGQDKIVPTYDDGNNNCQSSDDEDLQD